MIFFGVVSWRVSATAVARPREAAAALIMFTLLMVGCTSDDSTSQTQTEASPGDAVRSEVERGPVKFTVELVPPNPRLSDEPRLTLTLRTEQGVRVEKPPFGEALGEFLIRDFFEPPAQVDGKTEVTEQVYTLEPTRAGKLTVAPIAVQFYDEREPGSVKQYTIESEALTVEVSTMIGDQAPSLADLRPLAGPVALRARGGFAWLAVVVVFVLLAIAGWIVSTRRRQPPAQEPPRSPQELAWLELQQIIEAKLAESDVKTFYVELTGVVRRYIERSTGVHAPEQTTEEFLREIVDDALFADDDQQRLHDFLVSADLVKFPAFHPDKSDIEASFERAQEFIRLKRSTAPEVAV